MKHKSDDDNAFGYVFFGDKLFLELEVVWEFKIPDVWLLASRIEAIRNVASFSGAWFPVCPSAARQKWGAFLTDEQKKAPWTHAKLGKLILVL